MLFLDQLARLYDRSYRHLFGAPSLRFSRLTPQLHLDGQYTAKGLDILKKRGITAIISLRPKLYHHAVLQSFKVLHLPTTDKTPPSIADIQKGVQFITDEIKSGGVVYIHCRVGEGRAPTLTAAYLISTGMTVDEALATIRKTRPFIQPNKLQVDQLRLYHSSLSPALK